MDEDRNDRPRQSRRIDMALRTIDLSGSGDGAWTSRAACQDTDPDELFVQGADQNRARLRCGGCVVSTECLGDALDNRVEFGVWGGMTERERRALLRRRPDVVSWRLLLEQARAQHAARVTA